MSNISETFTHSITNSSFTISESAMINRVSIFNGTAVAGTVKGNRIVNNVESSGISIPQNATITTAADTGKYISGLVITAPASCTLTIVCN